MRLSVYKFRCQGKAGGNILQEEYIFLNLSLLQQQQQSRTTSHDNCMMRPWRFMQNGRLAEEIEKERVAAQEKDAKANDDKKNNWLDYLLTNYDSPHSETTSCRFPPSQSSSSVRFGPGHNFSSDHHHHNLWRSPGQPPKRCWQQNRPSCWTGKWIILLRHLPRPPRPKCSSSPAAATAPLNVCLDEIIFNWI